MWIKSKKYEELLDEIYEQKKSINHLAHILAAVILQKHNGIVEIVTPSLTGASIHWENKENHTIEIKAKQYLQGPADIISP